MPTRGKAGRYHHGDLRAALIDTAVEVIGEQGVRRFSVAEASRRLGVAVSAPYAHFDGRDDLLAAVAVRAYEVFHTESQAAMEPYSAPADRLAAMTGAYVRFAGRHRALFDVLFDAGLDKARHPEVAAAEQPIDKAFRRCVDALAESADGADELARAVEAVAHGYARLLLDDSVGHDDDVIERTAERAARAALALVAGRHQLTS